MTGKQRATLCQPAHSDEHPMVAQPSEDLFSSQEPESIPSAPHATVESLPPADVLDTLLGFRRVNTVILDPWYNKGVGGERGDYDAWLSEVIEASSRIADHVFVWAFRKSLPTSFHTFLKGSHSSRG